MCTCMCVVAVGFMVCVCVARAAWAGGNLENHVDVVRDDVDEREKGQDQEGNARRKKQPARFRIWPRAQHPSSRWRHCPGT